MLAAGCIPVFVSGDVLTASRYVPPFSELVDWPALSLHFAFDDRRPYWPVKLDAFDPAENAGLTKRILGALAALSPAQVGAMQEGVRQAWRKHLEPRAARRTFYELLKQRVAGAREAHAARQRGGGAAATRVVRS